MIRIIIGSLFFVSYCIGAEAAVTEGVKKSIPENVEYFGHSLMIQSTFEVVDAFYMSCHQTLPWESTFCVKLFGKSFCRFYDEWNCTSLKGEKGTFTLTGKVNYDKNTDKQIGSKLLSIQLNPSEDFTDPTPESPIFGMNVLNRVVDTAQDSYLLTCEKARYSIPTCIGSVDPSGDYREGLCHYTIKRNCKKYDNRKTGMKIVAHVHYGCALTTLKGKHQIYKIAVKPYGKLK